MSTQVFTIKLRARLGGLAMQAKLTPEQRRERSLKAWATRRAQGVTVHGQGCTVPTQTPEMTHVNPTVMQLGDAHAVVAADPVPPSAAHDHGPVRPVPPSCSVYSPAHVSETVPPQASCWAGPRTQQRLGEPPSPVGAVVPESVSTGMNPPASTARTVPASVSGSPPSPTTTGGGPESVPSPGEPPHAAMKTKERAREIDA